MYWTDHRAQLMLFPIFLVWGIFWKFAWNTLTGVWQERGSSPILPGTQLFHSVTTTNISDKPNLKENGLNVFSSIVWGCQQGDILLVQSQRACFSLWSIKQITVSKNSKILPCKSFTHGIAACKFWICKFDSFSKSEFCIFRPSPLCIERGKVG